MLLVLGLCLGCGKGVRLENPDPVLAPCGRYQPRARSRYPADPIAWSVDEPGGGTLDQGVYTAPLQEGVFHLTGRCRGGKVRVGVAVHAPGAFDVLPGHFVGTHTMAVGLLDGQVLLDGSEVSRGGLNATTLLDLRSGQCVGLAGPKVTHLFEGYLPLADGGVLAFGNTFSQRPPAASGERPATVAEALAGGRDLDRVVERFDPATGHWLPAGLANLSRSGHSATVLQDGRVLFYGGGQDPSEPACQGEVFDPELGTAHRTGPGAVERSGHAAALLPNGQVLLIGGTSRDQPNGALDLVETFDPGTETLTLSPFRTPVAWPHPQAATLADGRVVVVCGDRGFYAPGNPEDPAAPWCLDPATQVWKPYPEVGLVLGVRMQPDGSLVFWNADTVLLFDPASGRLRRLPAPFRLKAPPVVLPSGRIFLTDGKNIALSR